MALTDLTKKILADAAKQSERIITEANARAQKINEETENKLKEKRASFDARIKHTTEESEKKVIASAEQEQKTGLEKAKHELLDTMFEKVIHDLEQLDKDAYIERLLSLLILLPNKNLDAVIHAPEKRIAETTEATKRAGLSMKIIEDKNITGGVIIAGESFEYDLTFKTIINGKRHEIEPRVAQVLFP